MEIVSTLTKEEEAVTVFLAHTSKAIAIDIVAQLADYPSTDVAIEEITSRYFQLARNAVQFHVYQLRDSKKQSP